MAYLIFSRWKLPGFVTLLQIHCPPKIMVKHVFIYLFIYLFVNKIKKNKYLSVLEQITIGSWKFDITFVTQWLIELYNIHELGIIRIMIVFNVL